MRLVKTPISLVVLTLLIGCGVAPLDDAGNTGLNQEATVQAQRSGNVDTTVQVQHLGSVGSAVFAANKGAESADAPANSASASEISSQSHSNVVVPTVSGCYRSETGSCCGPRSHLFKYSCEHGQSISYKCEYVGGC